MRVFISWSGTRSQKVGDALSKFIRRVLQRTDPWYSKNSIRSGKLAYDELVKALHGTKFGILCVTADNWERPWLNFEAGALLRSVEATQVTPYLLDLNPSQLKPPLNMFQARASTHDDTLELCRDLNSALGPDALSADELNDHFEMWWPKLEQSLKEIEPTDAQPPEGPKELDLLRDIHAMLSRPPEKRSLDIKELKAAAENHMAKRSAIREKLKELDSCESRIESFEIKLAGNPTPEQATVYKERIEIVQKQKAEVLAKLDAFQ